MIIKIFNGTIVTGGESFTGNVIIKDGLIDYVGTENVQVPDDAHIIDATGLYVSPGFIDMHTHGAGGADFMDGTVEAYLTAARMHAVHGTTLLYPTTLTSTNELLFASFDTYRTAVEQNKDGARFGGLHLEGPYFNEMFAGAQDPRYLRNPKPHEYLEILDRCPDLARWSFAPELDGAAEFAAELHKRQRQRRKHLEPEPPRGALGRQDRPVINAAKKLRNTPELFLFCTVYNTVLLNLKGTFLFCINQKEKCLEKVWRLMRGRLFTAQILRRQLRRTLCRAYSS